MLGYSPRSLIITLCCLSKVWVSSAAPTKHTSPVVHIQNGTLAGLYDPIYHQDFFLGVPYAASPVGQLRFSMPAPAKAWNGTKSVKTPGPWCMGNSLGLVGFSQNISAPMSEDCLHLNIVRPTGMKRFEKLPVLAWIHGGGWQDGSANDGRYNGSFLVQTSVRMGTPIVFVSFNYRLGVFGMIHGPAVAQIESSNLLVHDQRQALRWIQENIAHFGGDASRVTIMGESAGAASIGQHLIAYGGRDEGLFSAAIAESGGPLSSLPFRNTTEGEVYSETILNSTGCTDAVDYLACLRAVPADALRRASLLVPASFTVDGKLFTDISSRLLRKGRFVKVPLLIGTNRNEGTSQLYPPGSKPLRSESDFFAFMKSSLEGRQVPSEALRNWSRLYQEEVENPSVAGLGTVLPNPGPEFGSEYGKTSLWAGDKVFTAGRRLANEIWADHGIPSYSYFFDTVTANVDKETLGVAHFQEIPFVFANKDGVGWEVDPFPTESGPRSKYIQLAEIMSRMWISFAVARTPNFHGGETFWPLNSHAACEM